MTFPLAISNASWYILGVIALFYGIRWRRNRSTLPLPPGPKKSLFVGNLFDLASERQWEAYLRWSKELSALVSHLALPVDSRSDSDIIHVDAAGTSVIVLSSMEAIKDLFEARSSLYSDR
jgi:hypothetical protein